MKQFEARVNRTLLCRWLDLPRSVYYYQPQSGIPGARSSQATMKLDGSWVDNQRVVNSIRQLLDVEFNALGYEYITYELKKEYLLNKKKVYRLMKEHNLLLSKVIRPTGKRSSLNSDELKRPSPWNTCAGISNMSGRAAGAVEGERRNYYLLSVIDVCSRKILDWLFQGSIRQIDLINLFRQINRNHELKGVILRNDNGSQFSAHSVRNRFGGPIFEKLRDQAGIHACGHPRRKFLHRPGRRSVLFTVF